MTEPITVTKPPSQPSNRANIVVIGNGMVGQRFCEKLVEFDVKRKFRIVTFCEESRSAYDRVGLTSFFAHRDAEKMMLARQEWYAEHGVELHIGDRANRIDRKKCVVHSDKGVTIAYDHVVIATGSYPFVPPVPGIHLPGVFVYRTIEDLQRIIVYAADSKRCAVIGGGLLGLEAAKAAYDLGLETHVVEFAPRLMPRQIDDAGSTTLVKKIELLGVHVHLGKSTKAIHGEREVQRIEFADGDAIDVDMIIVSAGIRPRDDLAKESGLALGERGGIIVNERLQTSDWQIFAIGECASFRGAVYGLVAPGYEMSEIVAANLTGDGRRFSGADLSTKLKLMGVDVASFGSIDAPAEKATPLVLEDPFSGVYKKLLFSPDGTRLLGGILVGDAADFGKLSMLSKCDAPLPCKPHELIAAASTSNARTIGLDAMPDSAQVCSCNNVSKGAICDAVRGGADTLESLKSCTKACTSCGGCAPLVSDLLQAVLAKAGRTVVNNVCEHFQFSRTELFAIVKAKRLRTFNEVLAHCGSGHGCEVCKPTVTSILASLWNDDILKPEHATLQDTNDRFLANIQRGGLYSVVPRVPGGEITPAKLATIARVAEKYKLYTKITGGQRIDMFGARLDDLPDIWEELVGAGFESGHAYAKALRTVKSCVGSTWCRYGVQDSVGFAIRVEHRYKGIRAPHKIKMAVSGCIRECAEAQCKDVGLIATEQGYNLYVCGNGGSKPRHADLLASDLDEELALQYVDRFLAYYIMTADRLTRTSVWLEKMEGGIDHIRNVVIHDKLRIAAELEAMTQHLVDTYECEWAAVVRDSDKRRRFRQFINSYETESCIEFVTERGQTRPADWPSDFVSLEQFRMEDGRALGELLQPVARWVPVGQVDDFPIGGGATVRYGNSQIAVFNFSSRGEWYATQNMCPHKQAFVLSRGIIGTSGEEPKIACPLHKKTFSLKSGESLQGDEYRIKTFRTKLEAGTVFVELPPPEALDPVMQSETSGAQSSCCNGHAPEVAACGLIGL
jgi:nitrite reductase (NADH) large subunit